MPNRCFHSLLSPPRWKKLSFKFSIGKDWTKTKAFKSGLTEDASCLRCEETETREHHIYVCENYSAKIWHLAGQSFTFTISRHSGDYILNIDLTPRETVLTNLICPSFSMSRRTTPEKYLSHFSKRSNETLSSNTPSLQHHAGIKNCYPRSKLIFSLLLTRSVRCLNIKESFITLML